MKSMTRKELAQLAGVSERTLRRWLHANHNQLIAALSSFAEKATSKGGEISDGVLWDREVEIEL